MPRSSTTKRRERLSTTRLVHSRLSAHRYHFITSVNRVLAPLTASAVRPVVTKARCRIPAPHMQQISVRCSFRSISATVQHGDTHAKASARVRSHKGKPEIICNSQSHRTARFRVGGLTTTQKHWRRELASARGGSVTMRWEPCAIVKSSQLFIDPEQSHHVLYSQNLRCKRSAGRKRKM